MAKHVLQIPFRDENDKEEAMRVLRDIRNGFKLGVENPENLPLNLEWKRMETYTIKERIFVNEHLTEQLKLGKMDTLKKGEIPENYIFIHPIDKETGDKINHQTKKGRICRDATKSREGVYNLNPLTPDEHVAFNTLPYKQDVARIFVKAQRNCWIFKCDFKDSFRQLATAPSEWLKACYYYMGWNIKDCVDLYGTRGASKRMQEVSVLIARAFDHWVRKHKLSKDEEFFNLCYIDDHFATIKCASFERAKQIMNYFLIFLKKVGIVESEHKREGPAQVMKIIGLKRYQKQQQQKYQDVDDESRSEFHAEQKRKIQKKAAERMKEQPPHKGIYVHSVVPKHQRPMLEDRECGWWAKGGCHHMQKPWKCRFFHGCTRCWRCLSHASAACPEKTEMNEGE